jgi:hypothetical protein
LQQIGLGEAMKRATKFGIALAAMVACTTAFGEERHDNVLLSDEAFAAFQCSVFAAHARYDAEEKRLFSIGLEKARLFIQAARKGGVSKEEFEHTKVIWLIALRIWNFQPLDTSTDFVAGTVYEYIWEDATGELGKRTTDKATYQGPAREEFSSHNCSVLAR